MVHLRDEVKALARSEGLLFRERRSSKRVGVHFDNRYGDGVVPSDVHALIGNIFGQGFSEAALQDPTCSEVPPPEHPRHQKFIKFNEEIIAGSAGQLPPYDEATTAVSQTCGHTSQGLLVY